MRNGRNAQFNSGFRMRGGCNRGFTARGRYFYPSQFPCAGQSYGFNQFGMDQTMAIRDFSCSQRLWAGMSTPVSWRVDQEIKAKCSIILQSHSQAIDRVLWSDLCCPRLGENSVTIQVPEDINECAPGDCFVKMIIHNELEQIIIKMIEVMIKNMNNKCEPLCKNNCSSECNQTPAPTSICASSLVELTATETATYISTQITGSIFTDSVSNPYFSQTVATQTVVATATSVIESMVTNTASSLSGTPGGFDNIGRSPNETANIGGPVSPTCICITPVMSQSLVIISTNPSPSVFPSITSFSNTAGSFFLPSMIQTTGLSISTASVIVTESSLNLITSSTQQTSVSISILPTTYNSDMTSSLSTFVTSTFSAQITSVVNSEKTSVVFSNTSITLVTPSTSSTLIMPTVSF